MRLPGLVVCPAGGGDPGRRDLAGLAGEAGQVPREERFDIPVGLCGSDKAVLTEYGAFGEKKMYGKHQLLGLIRSTFVVNPDGTIDKAMYNVRAKGHVAKLRGELGLDGTATIGPTRVWRNGRCAQDLGSCVFGRESSSLSTRTDDTGSARSPGCKGSGRGVPCLPPLVTGNRGHGPIGRSRAGVAVAQDLPSTKIHLPVVRPAQQAHLVDIGCTALRPGRHMVGLALARRSVTEDAATITQRQCGALAGARQSGRAPQGERLASGAPQSLRDSNT